MHKVIIDDILDSSCTADTQYKTYFSIPPPCLAIGPSTSSQQKKKNNKNSALHSELHYSLSILVCHPLAINRFLGAVHTGQGKIIYNCEMR